MDLQHRKDAWNLEDDIVLAETVLDHIRNGSTQIKAFEEVAGRLGRTPAACGFRWNSQVRKQYEKEIKTVKSVRIQSKIATISDVKALKKRSAQAAISEQIDSVLQWMLKLKDLLVSKDNEIGLLKEQNEELSKREVTISEDYQILLAILERARSLGVLEKIESDKAFKMDANGNLERIG